MTDWAQYQLDQKTKREELATYRQLKLSRDLKSAKKRKRLNENPKTRVLGDGALSTPHLVVDRDKFMAIWRETAAVLLRQARDAGMELSPDQLLPMLRPRIEALTYARLASENGWSLAQSHNSQRLGRQLTALEQSIFQETQLHGQEWQSTTSDFARLHAAHTTHTALDSVLSQVAGRQTHNPARYQAIWAEIVGLDAAAQSELVSVNETTETAFFRCLNSVLSMSLQRKTDLPKKLASALGKKVKKLRASF